MTRIDLKKSSGFPLIYDGENLISDELSYSDKRVFSISDLKNQLLNDEVTCPDFFYIKYSNWDKDGIYNSKNLQVNFYIVMPNLAGVEFVKTRAVTCTNNHRIIEILYGGGTLINQDFDTTPEGNIWYSTLKKGQKAIIRSGFSSCIANTKLTPLIYLEICPSNSIFDDSLDDMKGMSYYVIRKNAKQEVVRNPEYRLVTEPRKVNFEKVLTKFGITNKTPIIKQILRKYEKFSWLFNSDDINI